MKLQLPKAHSEIIEIQRKRKLNAFQQAMRSPFYKNKLNKVNPEFLDHAAEWRKIPILTKDELRDSAGEQFYDRFCLAASSDIAEYWRSGGVTGQPLFYPRTFEDIRYAKLAFDRIYECTNCSRGESIHLSMPLGFHPIGLMFGRSAFDYGLAVTWAGSGASVPSTQQLELIQNLKPTIWIGMSSYALILGNLAESMGVNLAESSVKKLICSAEPLSPIKREKLESMWGAKVYDCFGMTEAGIIGSEDEARQGYRVWTDMFFIEVVRHDSDDPVEVGEPGRLIVTPLWTNNATPFLRWDSGDIVSYLEANTSGGAYSVFPLIKHAGRTIGFFKFRGINISHTEFEDFVFSDLEISDFKAELLSEKGQDNFRLSIETVHNADPQVVARKLEKQVKERFEVSSEVVVLDHGTLAEQFESDIKVQRFRDKRA